MGLVQGGTLCHLSVVVIVLVGVVQGGTLCHLSVVEMISDCQVDIVGAVTEPK